MPDPKKPDLPDEAAHGVERIPDAPGKPVLPSADEAPPGGPPPPPPPPSPPGVGGG